MSTNLAADRQCRSSVKAAPRETSVCVPYTQAPGQWAAPLREASNPSPLKAASALDGGAVVDSSDEEEMLQPKHAWAAALINRFGDAGGFDALQQVRLEF